MLVVLEHRRLRRPSPRPSSRCSARTGLRPRRIRPPRPVKHRASQPPYLSCPTRPVSRPGALADAPPPPPRLSIRSPAPRRRLHVVASGARRACSAVAVRGAGVVLWSAPASAAEKPTLEPEQRRCPGLQAAASKKLPVRPRFARSVSSSAQLGVGWATAARACATRCAAPSSSPPLRRGHSRRRRPTGRRRRLRAGARAGVDVDLHRAPEGFERWRGKATAMKLKINEGGQAAFRRRRAARADAWTAGEAEGRDRRGDAHDAPQGEARHRARRRVQGRRLLAEREVPRLPRRAHDGADAAAGRRVRAAGRAATLVAVREVATSEHHTPISRDGRRTKCSSPPSLTGGAIASRLAARPARRRHRLRRARRERGAGPADGGRRRSPP